MADYFLLDESKEQLLDNLTQVEWSNPYKDVDDEIKRIENTHTDQEPESNLVQHFDEINWLMDFYAVEDTVAHLKDYESESEWMNKSLKGL